MLTEKAAKVPLRQKPEVLTPQQVQGVLEMKGHLWLTGKRLTKYQTFLLDNPEVTVKTCNTLNPVSLMPTESYPDLTHSCSDIINFTHSSRTDLLEQSLQWVLAKFLPPPAGGEDQGNNLVPLKDCLSSLPYTLLNKYNSTNATVIAATLDLVSLCGTPNNWLTHHSELQAAVAYTHLSNSKHRGDCTLGTLAPQDLTIINITQSPEVCLSSEKTKNKKQKQKQPFGLVVAGAAATMAAAALWGGSAYHEATLRELTKIVGEVSKDTTDTLAGLSR